MAVETFNTSLEAKIYLTNRGNTIKLELYDLLAPFFSEYIGQPIFKKTDRQLLKKIAEKLPDLKGFQTKHGLQSIWMGSYRDYSVSYEFGLYANVKSTRYEGETYSKHESFMVYICSMRDGLVETIHSRPEDLRTDYTAETVRPLIAEYHRIKELLGEAECACGPFNPDKYKND